MLLLVDNYDSFTYNLYQYLCELGEKISVVRNDKMSIKEMGKLAPRRIVISPGPGYPRDAGISCEVIRHFGDSVPVLGVCLGHQCLAEVYGSVIDHAGEIKHGKSSLIHHDDKGVFKGLPNPFPAIRYHSLAVRPETVPDCLEVSAKTDNNIIMGLRHKELPVEGVQFHPESIMTEVGKDLLKNFLEMGSN